MPALLSEGRVVLGGSAMIVVGVDGSESSLAALRWAIEEAQLRRSTVKAVYTWSAPLTGGGFEYVPTDVLNHEHLAASARRALDEWIDAAGGETAGVEIEREAVRGAAAHVLVTAAADTELLVIGSRGHGGFAGLLLGSVSQQCAHHARCPVVIVRTRPAPWV